MDPIILGLLITTGISLLKDLYDLMRHIRKSKCTAGIFSAEVEMREFTPELKRRDKNTAAQ